jgi:hypothetical protein
LISGDAECRFFFLRQLAPSGESEKSESRIENTHVEKGKVQPLQEQQEEHKSRKQWQNAAVQENKEHQKCKEHDTGKNAQEGSALLK